MKNKVLLSGNEAIALGAYQAGVKLAFGYPGTPSTEILENFAGYPGVHAQWSSNEKVALEEASGASLAGARALVTMKHVGLNVAADPLFTLSYTGVGAGLVVVSADDPQLYSSQNEQDNRHYARAAKVPYLEPADSQEALDMVIEAFAISERFDTPVILRTTTRLAHSKTVVDADIPGVPAAVPQGRPPEKNPAKLVMVPAHGQKRHVLVEERLDTLRQFTEVFPGNRLEEGSTEIGIIASGVAYQYAREVFPQASFLKLTMPWPLPVALVRELAARVKTVYVIEELDPFLEEQVKAAGIPVIGKEALPRCGEYTPAVVSRALTGKEEPGVVALGTYRVPPRPPILCPGCPHRGIFHLLGKGKYFVTGDIGCYTLAAMPPLAALDTCLCMGAGIGQAIGIDRALKGVKHKTAAVIGDSTFFHSGLTPLVDIVHSGAAVTVIVLDNGTTAMTGRQDHAGTAKDLMGRDVPRVDIAAVARAVGIATVIETSAFDLKSIGDALAEAEAFPGAALIVNRGPCVLLSRGGAPALSVDTRSCTGCRVCLSIGCPAVGWRDDVAGARNKMGVAEIDAGLCDGCGICAQVCRFGAIAGEGKRK